MVKLNIWFYLGILLFVIKIIECILFNYDIVNFELGKLNLIYDFF